MRALASHALPAFVLVAALLGCKGGSKDEAPSPDPTPVAPALDASAATRGPPFVRHASAAAAVQSLLRRGPRVIGFGEYHQKVGAAKVKTSLTRFRTEILPAISGAASDLVLETWVEPPNCGKRAVAVSTDVQKTIERPPETENELIALLKVAEARGLGRHVLKMSCADYASFRKDKEVDYDALLQAIAKRLGEAAAKALDAQKVSDATPVRPAVFVYGGSMHNEVHPFAGTEAYSYVSSLTTALGADNKYLEIDLFVPELIADSKLFASQAWFEVAKREANSDNVLVFERSPTSYLIILKRGVAPE